MTQDLLLSVLDYLRLPYCKPFVVDVLVAFVIDRSESNMNAIFFAGVKIFYFHHKNWKHASEKVNNNYKKRQEISNLPAACFYQEL